MPREALKDEGFEAGGDGGGEFEAEGFGARDDFLGVGNVGGGDVVDDFGGGVAEHALGAHVEELDDAFFVGGDAGEVGAVEDGVLEGSGFEEGGFAADFGDNVGFLIGHGHGGLT